MKTRTQWFEEADSFISNWFASDEGRMEPSKDDVIAECRTIEDIENPEEYAETLWAYISELLDEY